MESSKHSLSGILVKYIEQAREDGTKSKVHNPITYQSRTFMDPKRTGVLLMKEA